MTIKERNKIDELEGKVNDLEKKIDKILFYLESDATTNQKGLVERVSLLAKNVSEIMKREEIFKGKATVWGIVGGALLSIIIWIGKFLISKIAL